MSHLSELSDAQALAVDLLVAGNTDIEVAQRVGRSRQTVNGWRNHDVAFIRELEARRAYVRSSSADLLVQLQRKALDVVAEKLDEGDLAAAMFVLKLAGPDRLASRPSPPSIQSVRSKMALDLEASELYGPSDPVAVEIIEAEWSAHCDPPLIEVPG